jgi:hypothetical protein
MVGGGAIIAHYGHLNIAVGACAARTLRDRLHLLVRPGEDHGPVWGADARLGVGPAAGVTARHSHGRERPAERAGDLVGFARPGLDAHIGRSTTLAWVPQKLSGSRPAFVHVLVIVFCSLNGICLWVETHSV